MKQHFELIGVVKSLWLQMRQNIQLIRIKVCWLKNLSNISAALIPQFGAFLVETCCCLFSWVTDQMGSFQLIWNFFQLSQYLHYSNISLPLFVSIVWDTTVIWFLIIIITFAIFMTVFCNLLHLSWSERFHLCTPLFYLFVTTCRIYWQTSMTVVRKLKVLWMTAKNWVNRPEMLELVLYRSSLQHVT